jgi:hypothetical protein
VVACAAQDRVPKFTEYPARVIRSNRSVKIQVHSTAYTACFRTMLRKTARGGQLFAGHYAIWDWGCGTCLRAGIVDLVTGRAYVSPFEVSTAQGVFNVMANSRLLVVNDPELDRTSYFLWNGRHLLPISDRQVARREPEAEFSTCSEMTRYSPSERALLGRVIEEQSGYASNDDARRAFEKKVAGAETVIERSKSRRGSQSDDQVIATFGLPQGRFYSIVRVEKTQVRQTYARSLEDALAFDKLRRRKP